MLDAKVSKFLWTKGVNTTTCLYNYSPTRSNLGIHQRVIQERNQTSPIYKFLGAQLCAHS